MLNPAIVSQILDGFSIVAILLIASLGLAIIFGVAGVINMAHGEFIMVGAYTAAVVQNFLGGNTFVSIPAAFVVVAALGLLVERSVIRFLYDRPLETLLATWGVGIACQVIIKLIFGPELYYVGGPKVLDGHFSVGGNLPFPYYRLFLIGVSLGMLFITYWVLYRTDFGLKVRAVRRNRSITSCLGIDTTQVDMIIFAFGSGLAGVAGAIVAPIKTVSPTMGFPYAVDAYMVLILGGVGKLVGVVAGSAVIGESETVLSFVYNNVIGQLMVFITIVVLIRIWPRGLFGYQER
jgi:urea transport system permease protein